MIARRLVTLGAIERPVIPEYTTRMVVALRRYAWDGEGERTFAAAEHLVPAKPGSLHLMLELAARIGIAPGTKLPAAITRLASGKNSSRIAAAARRLAPGTP